MPYKKRWDKYCKDGKCYSKEQVQAIEIQKNWC